MEQDISEFNHSPPNYRAPIPPKWRAETPVDKNKRRQTVQIEKIGLRSDVLNQKLEENIFFPHISSEPVLNGSDSAQSLQSLDDSTLSSSQDFLEDAIRRDSIRQLSLKSTKEMLGNSVSTTMRVEAAKPMPMSPVRTFEECDSFVNEELGSFVSDDLDDETDVSEFGENENGEGHLINVNETNSNNFSDKDVICDGVLSLIDGKKRKKKVFVTLRRFYLSIHSRKIKDLWLLSPNDSITIDNTDEKISQLYSSMAGYSFSIHRNEKSISFFCFDYLSMNDWIEKINLSMKGKEIYKRGILLMTNKKKKHIFMEICVHNSNISGFAQKQSKILKLIDLQVNEVLLDQNKSITSGSKTGLNLVAGLNPNSQQATFDIVAKPSNNNMEISMKFQSSVEVCNRWFFLLNKQIGLSKNIENTNNNINLAQADLDLLLLSNRLSNLLYLANNSCNISDINSNSSSNPTNDNVNNNGRTKKKNIFVILSCDGGGLRGVIPCTILQRICEKFDNFIDSVDFFAGSSNGAMVSTLLAMGITPSVCRLVLEVGSEVFGSPASAINRLNQSKYSNVPLKILMDSILGDVKMGDIKKNLLIPSFQLCDNMDDSPNTSDSTAAQPTEKSWQVKHHHNISLNENVSKLSSTRTNDFDKMSHSGSLLPSKEMLVADALMRTSAAPTYFPSYQNHVDGSVFDQSPCLSALLFAISPYCAINRKIEEIVVISVGTGDVKRYLEGEENDWGISQWLPKIINIMWDGMVFKATELCKLMIGDNFHRTNVRLDSEVAMDDPKLIPNMTNLAMNENLDATFDWIEKHIYEQLN